MGFKEWIIPQEKHFFEMLEQQADIVLEGAEALLDMARNFDHVAEKRDKIKEIERKGDEVVHDIAESLNKTFVTPSTMTICRSSPLVWTISWTSSRRPRTGCGHTN